MKKLVVPKFATEAEEAEWWDAHMDVVGENLIEAIKNGTAHRGGPKRVLEERRQSKNITIRIPNADIERARKLSAKKGLGYQTYMKMLLREALDREEAALLKPRSVRRRKAS
jgi:predicted DNA binding CopG/RHH family protein